MFTGIIEALGKIKAKHTEGSNCVLTIETSMAAELKVDQSVSHNGVCLTVTDLLAENQYQVVAVEETLQKSNLGDLAVGSLINLERSMTWGGRVDGHLVQGHVDTTGTCTQVVEKDGSWNFIFQFQAGDKHHLVVEKGSICINGVSLTCFNTTNNSFEVTIIPYTYEHTNFHKIEPGDRVNLEFDIIGKYVQRLMERT